MKAAQLEIGVWSQKKGARSQEPGGKSQSI